MLTHLAGNPCPGRHASAGVARGICNVHLTPAAIGAGFGVGGVGAGGELHRRGMGGASSALDEQTAEIGSIVCCLPCLQPVQANSTC